MKLTEKQRRAYYQAIAKQQNEVQSKAARKRRGQTLDPSFMFLRNSCWPKDKR